MLDILVDAIIDCVKLIPFLFVTYLIMEYLEHKTIIKNKEHIKKSGRLRTCCGRPFRRVSAMWIFGFCN